MSKLIYIIVFLSSSQCFSQDFSKSNSISLVVDNLIESVDIYKVHVSDTAEVDTAIYESLFFDIKGRLIEKREEYNQNQSLYISTTYTYKNDLEYIVLFNNPYILGSVLIQINISSEEYFYDDITGRVDSVLIKLINGGTRKKQYTYNPVGLMKEMSVYYDNELVCRYLFNYKTASNRTNSH